MTKKRKIKLSHTGMLVAVIIIQSVIFITYIVYIRIKIQSTFFNKQDELTSDLAILKNNRKIFELSSNDDSSLDEIISPLENGEARAILFSHYSIDDRTGVNNVGALGIGINDFETNEFGWYTYQGKVACSCAMDRMGIPRENYRIWAEFETFVFEFKDRKFEGICIDTGLAMLGWEDEVIQRIDIWVTSTEYWFGLQKGVVYE